MTIPETSAAIWKRRRYVGWTLEELITLNLEAEWQFAHLQHPDAVGYSPAISLVSVPPVARVRFENQRARYYKEYHSRIAGTELPLIPEDIDAVPDQYRGPPVDLRDGVVIDLALQHPTFREAIRLAEIAALAAAGF